MFNAGLFRYVRDACDSSIKIIRQILRVDSCQIHSKCIPAEETLNEDFSALDVDDESPQSLLNMDEEEEEEEDKKKLRKRKQDKKVKSANPSTSPTSSPSKRPKRGRTVSAPGSVLDEDNVSTSPMPNTNNDAPDKEDPMANIPPASEVISLIESHRKGVRAHGLLQFVLWRETLKKVEKDKDTKKGTKTRLRRTTII